MPLGDPGGGLFEYTVEGLPKMIFMASIPVSDIDKRIGFYTDLLKMDVLYRNEKEAAIRLDDCTLLLKRSDSVGIDTGVYIGVDDPYDLHRRLIDEGVVFVEDPVRSPLGVTTSFRDDDGNLLHVIEMNAPLKL